jgi:cobaltochelatase CobN
VVLGGEQAPDAELMELSTVAAGIAAEAHVCMAYSKGSSKHIAVVLLSA